MVVEFLYHIPIYVVFLFLVIVFPVSAFLGYLLGINYFRDKEVVEHSSFIPTTILGLLALLLGFTFSMAVDRYNRRSEVVVKEANAIGTAYLRTDLIPEPYRTKAREALREYVSLRIATYNVGYEKAKIQNLRGRSVSLQDTLWADIKPLASKDRTPIMGLYIAAMNDVIDVSSERHFATDNQVPEVVYLIIFIVTFLGVTSLGFIDGTAGKKSRFGIFMLSLLFSAVIALIQDLDRPRRGIIRVSQQSLLDLQSSMKD
ncbi:hypothetical protein [Bdellovibrio sp. HCB2-146]|uniref:bestrophin-like domain n=1 Tax=Bdellovibrio sp. HCB2-146 TaxID=3394362 RepID=UPI0039BC2C73